MRIGILETGEVNPALLDQFGSYSPMFEALLAGEDTTFFTVSVVRGEMPDSVTDADGWVITGSRHGVYEDHPWIEPLKLFLRGAVEARVPVIGVCFGHQILAEALGGKVIKSEKGWGVGVHHYTPETVPSWMDGLAQGFAARAVHQDQVVEVPDDAHVLASSAFCPYAALAYGDPEAPYAISVQPHPEFSADFVRGIVETRAGDGIPMDVAQSALASLDQPVNNADWGRWMRKFLEIARENAA
jgi:GMP synthase-like glutamine amidotransferase